MMAHDSEFEKGNLHVADCDGLEGNARLRLHINQLLHLFKLKKTPKYYIYLKI